jgi:hypothetical protein
MSSRHTSKWATRRTPDPRTISLLAIAAVALGAACGAAAQCPVTQLTLSPAPSGGDDAGAAVAIFGNHAMAGDPVEDNPAWGAPGLDSGAVYVSRRVGGVWSTATRMYAASSLPQANGERFGAAVAIFDDWAVIGAPGFDTSTVANCGVAYVYWFNGSTWQFKQRLFAFNTPGTPNPVANETFGSSVAIDGETIVVGGPQYAPSGRACVYRFNGTSWLDEQRLLHPSASVGAHFGRSVAVRGARIAVGAPLHTYAGFTGLGSAISYVYQGGPVPWVQSGPVLSPIVAGDNAACGRSVAVLPDAVFAGTPGATLSTSTNGAGCVSYFPFVGSTLTGVFGITAPTPTVGAAFGGSVSVDGDRLLVGAQMEDEPGKVDAGAAYTFQYSAASGSWGSPQRLIEPVPVASRQFGASVSISGTDAMIGAPGLFSSGAAYINPVACPPPPPQKPLLLSPISKVMPGISGSIIDSIVVKDFDADGNLDLAGIISSPPAMFVRWGDGLGGFHPIPYTLAFPSVAGAVTDVTAADLDNDGYMDLVIAAPDAMLVRIARYAGNRTFAHLSVSVAPERPDSIAAGEFTGDCRTDIAFVNAAAKTLRILRNDGSWQSFVWNWAFTLTSTVKVTDAGPDYLTAVDIDGDGDDDLTLANTSARTVYFYRNNGGTFTDIKSGVLFPTNSIGGLALGDIDGDGDVDAVVTDNWNNQVVTVRYNPAGAGTLTTGSVIPVSGNPYGAALGDIDGDNDADLVLTSATPGSPNLIVLQNYGNGSFAPPVVIGPIMHGPHAVRLADLTFSGTLDLVIATNNGECNVMLNSTPYDCNGNGIPDQAEPLAMLPIGVVGPSVATICAWELQAAGIQVGGFSGCSPSGSPPAELAARLVERINRAGVPAGRARRMAAYPNAFEIAAPGSSVSLCTGPTGALVCMPASPAATCNPTLIVLSGNDCNGNGMDDTIDIYLGVSADADGDGVPDECQEPALPGDLDGDDDVDQSDLGILLADYGCISEKVGKKCKGDVDGDGDTDQSDLGILLANYGL